MKLDQFSLPTQEGLRLWAKAMLADQVALEGTATEQWAWLYFQLRVSPDRPEWFPKGKSATLQLIEDNLLKDASQATLLLALLSPRRRSGAPES